MLSADVMPASAADGRMKVGYVCKVYPRFSETFILTEILAHERTGLDLEIFSLRSPVEGRFHELLADVRSPVNYLGASSVRFSAAWSDLRAAMDDLPRMRAVLPELLAADGRDALQAVELARAVTARGITHLHAHFASVATTVARLAALLSGVPFSFTAHAKDIFHDEVDLEDLRRKIADAAAVITVSDFNLAHLRAICGEVGVIRRVYNGLDLARFTFDPPQDRPPEVVAVGRLVEKKGFHDLVDAISVLRDELPQVRCRIVGAGPLEAGLGAHITALDLDEFITLTGPLPQAEVRRIVAGAAVFAAPCVVGEDGNRDGLPTVLLEAMALGTPCVATDVTGIPEVLADGTSGLAVRQRDPTALAGAIARLLDDPILRCRLAESARRRVERDFDTERQAAKLRESFAAGTRRPRSAPGRIPSGVR